MNLRLRKRTSDQIEPTVSCSMSIIATSTIITIYLLIPRNRKYWSGCVLLEEEQNRNIDIFAMCLKDKRKDLALINKLKEEVKLLKSMNVDLYKKMDIMEHNEKEHENIDKMLDVVTEVRQASKNP